MHVHDRAKDVRQRGGSIGRQSDTDTTGAVAVVAVVVVAVVVVVVVNELTFAREAAVGGLCGPAS